MFDRDKVIETLVNDDMNVIIDCGHETFLADILHNGFKGYGNMGDYELMKECEERDISYLFGEDE
jgi:hypothetical protein